MVAMEKKARTTLVVLLSSNASLLDTNASFHGHVSVLQRRYQLRMEFCLSLLALVAQLFHTTHFVIQLHKLRE